MNNASKPVIGLVGGVGAGKSTVAAELAALGCAVIDGDVIGHELLQAPDVKTLIHAQWGDGVFTTDGEVSRPAMAEKVFSDPQALARLNQILHPRIRAEIEHRIRCARSEASVPAVVLDAAVLFEAGWDDLCTACIYVRAAQELRARRSEGRGWSRSSWQRREKSQISLDTKASKCEYTIDNSSSISCLRDQVRRIYQQIVRVSDHR